MPTPEELGVHESGRLLSSADGHHLKSPAARRCSGLFTLAVIASVLTLLTLVKISLFDSFAKAKPPSSDATDDGGPPSHDGLDDFRRPSSEYMLDAGWDFNAPPAVRAYRWVITDIEANPDGVFRPMITINGKYPGELVRCNQGDTVVVHVENRSANTTALHWHGLFQNGSNWMDGTPGVTQCGIAPGRSFRYEFTVTGQSGTCKYPHHREQSQSIGGRTTADAIA